jgi:hypothetical protein
MTPLKSSFIDSPLPPDFPVLDKRESMRFENNLFQAVVEKHLTTSDQAARLGDYKMEMFDVFATSKFSKLSKKTFNLAYDIIKIANPEVDAICEELERNSKLDMFYRHVFSVMKLLGELKREGVIKKKDDFLDKIEKGVTYFFNQKSLDKVLTLSYYLDVRGLRSSFGTILDDHEGQPQKEVESYRNFLFITKHLKRKKIVVADELLVWVYKELAAYSRNLIKNSDIITLDHIFKLIPAIELPLVLARIAKKFGFRYLLKLKEIMLPSSTYAEAIYSWLEANKEQFFFKSIKNHDAKDFLSIALAQEFQTTKKLLDAFISFRSSHPIKIVEACAFILACSEKIKDEFLSFQIKVWVQRNGENYGYNLKI